jgi:hypothetical protein
MTQGSNERRLRYLRAISECGEYGEPAEEFVHTRPIEGTDSCNADSCAYAAHWEKCDSGE